jgi:hypothetical protein
VHAEDHSYVCGSGNGSFLLGGVPGRGMEGMQQHLFLVLLTRVPDSDFAIDVSVTSREVAYFYIELQRL